MSSIEGVKLNQELLAYGYMRKNISMDIFPETLIPIIISFMNCILDLVYDKTIHHGRWTWYSDKKIELKHFIFEEGMGSIALIDHIFNRKLCRNFRIDFRITFEDKKPEYYDNRMGWARMGSLQSRQCISPAFRVGYLTKLDEKMREKLNEKDGSYEQLGRRGAAHTFGVGISKSGSTKYHETQYYRTDTDMTFDNKLEQEDIISLFSSFESYKSAVYHN